MEEIIDSSSEALGEQMSPIIPREGGVDNCFLESINISKKENGEEDSVDFEFVEKSEKGDVIGRLVQKYWNPFKPNYDTDEEGIKKEARRVVSCIKHILGRYVDSSKLEIKKEGFFNWVKAVVPQVSKEKRKSTPVKLKVIYNNKGFSTLARYPDFISSEEFPKQFVFKKQFDPIVPPEGEESAISSAPSGNDSSIEDAASAFD